MNEYVKIGLMSLSIIIVGFIVTLVYQPLKLYTYETAGKATLLEAEHSSHVWKTHINYILLVLLLPNFS